MTWSPAATRSSVDAARPPARRRRAPSSSPRGSRPGRRPRPSTADAHVDGQDGAGHRGDERRPDRRHARAVARRPRARPDRRPGRRRGGTRRSGRRGRRGRRRRRATVVERGRGVARAATDRVVALGLEPDALAGRSAASRRPTGHRSVRGGRPGERRDRPRPRPRPGSPPGSAQSSGGQIRSSVSVRASPSRTTGCADQPAQEPQVRDEAEDDRLVERRASAGRALPSRSAPHAMILASIGSNRPPTSVPWSIPASTRMPSPAGQRRRLDPTGRRQEPVLGILGVEPDLDRVAPSSGRPSCVEAERLAGGDPELVGDEVASGDELGDRVLDLEPRVHLEEGRLAAVVEQELAGPGADVADRAPRGPGPRRRAARAARRRPPATGSPRGPSGGGAGSSSRARRGGRRCPAASNSTWISTWRAPSTNRSRISRSSPNAACASRRAAASASGSVAGSRTDAHALAAAAGRRLDEERVADRCGGARSAPRPTGRRRRSPARTGTPSDAASRRAAALSPIARIAAGGGPTQRMPAASTALGEVGVLGEEAEARMERVGAGWRARRRRRRRRRAGRGARARRCRARRPGSRGDRRSGAIRRAISPRLAMNRRSDRARMASACAGGCA